MGMDDKWGDEPRGLCFVCRFEYSHNNPNPGTKFGSFDKARTAAIHGLHHACSARSAPRCKRFSTATSAKLQQQKLALKRSMTRLKRSGAPWKRRERRSIA